MFKSHFHLNCDSTFSRKNFNEKETLKTIKESMIDFTNFKKTNTNNLNAIPKKQILNKLEMDDFDQRKFSNEQDKMIEQNNRIDVHDLDKWLDNNKSQFTSHNEFYEKNTRKNPSNDIFNKTKLCFRTPNLRLNILNSIVQEEEETNDFKESLFSPQTDKKQHKIMRSLESVKTGINQELINEIYFKKLMKKNKAKGVIDKKLLSKIEPNEISNDTFNNFKSLKKIMKNQIFVLDYDQIYKKIQFAASSQSEKIFDYSNELKRLESEQKRLVGFEEELLNKFIIISKEIKQKLNIEIQIRMMNYMNNKKIRTQKENLESVNIRYNMVEDKIYSQNDKRQSTFGQRKSMLDGRLEKNVAEFMRVQKFQDEKEKAENDIKKTILKLSDQMKMNQTNLLNLNHEIKAMKSSKRHIQIELKDLYLKFMKEKDDKYKHVSLTWIIKAFWRINLEFSANDLPHFLDENSITYLFQNAKLEYEFENLSQMKKKIFLPQTYMNYSTSTFQTANKTSQSALQTSNKTMTNFGESSKLNTSSKLKEITSKLHKVSLIKNKTAKYLPETGSGFDEMNFDSITMEEPLLENAIEIIERPEVDQINEASIDVKMKAINNEIENLKEKEIKRLNEFYLENNRENVNSISRVFECLFGEKEAARIITNFLNEKKEKTNVKNSRSMSDNNILKIDFSLQNIKSNKNNELRNEISNQFKKRNIYNGSGSVNFQYNLLYNKAPTLQNQFPNSTFLKFNLKN